jgi:hypothetical protein
VTSLQNLVLNYNALVWIIFPFSPIFWRFRLAVFRLKLALYNSWRRCI